MSQDRRLRPLRGSPGRCPRANHPVGRGSPRRTLPDRLPYLPHVAEECSNRMMPKFTRREFLKKSGLLATAGTLALSGCGGRGNEERLVPFLRTPEEQVAGTFTYCTSLCQMCPAGCGILVRTMNGHVNKLEGNPRHPISQGRLCARGQAGLQALYNPDRLQGPEVRGNQRTDPFEPTNWDEGLAVLGQALSESQGRIAIYGGHLPDHVYRVAARLMEAAGGSRRPTVWNLYRAAEGRNLLQQAAGEILGAERLPLFDIGAAGAVISFNAAFLETWLSPVQYSRGFAELRTGANRGSLVAVEPRLSSTAAVADDWLSPPGGREGEVALIVGRLILDERLAAGDRPASVDALFSQVEGRNLAEELGLDFEKLVRIARRFARSEAPLAIPGGGLTAFDNAPAAIRAVLALNLLVGAPNRTLSLGPPAPAGGPRKRVRFGAPTSRLSASTARIAAGALSKAVRPPPGMARGASDRANLLAIRTSFSKSSPSSSARLRPSTWEKSASTEAGRSPAARRSSRMSLPTIRATSPSRPPGGESQSSATAAVDERRGSTATRLPRFAPVRSSAKPREYCTGDSQVSRKAALKLMTAPAAPMSNRGRRSAPRISPAACCRRLRPSAARYRFHTVGRRLPPAASINRAATRYT